MKNINEKYQRYFYKENWYLGLTLTEIVESRIRYYYDKVWGNVPAKNGNPYMSHVPVLLTIGANSNLGIRRILELGTGMFSTLTFLDRENFGKLECLNSIETDHLWAKKILDLVHNEERLNLKLTEYQVADSLKDYDVDNYDLIFVDDSITREDRSRTIETLGALNLKNAIIVIHDFDMPSYQKAARSFKNKYRFCGLYPNTGIVWNNKQFSIDFIKKTEVIIKSMRKKGLIPKDDEDAMKFYKILINSQ
ncbi:MAG: hypothetical protein WCP85_19950 [Mariniphaga sp.]